MIRTCFHCHRSEIEKDVRDFCDCSEEACQGCAEACRRESMEEDSARDPREDRDDSHLYDETYIENGKE